MSPGRTRGPVRSAGSPGDNYARLPGITDNNHENTMKVPGSRGFSLIELLITIAVLSLITTMAVNTYRGSVLKARRAEAKTSLMELAQLLERNYTETNSFATNISGNSYALPFTVSPRNGTTHYNLSLPVQTTMAFTLRAVPAGAQADDTRCNVLTLNQAGIKTKSGSGPLAECW